MNMKNFEQNDDNVLKTADMNAVINDMTHENHRHFFNDPLNNCGIPGHDQSRLHSNPKSEKKHSGKNGIKLNNFIGKDPHILQVFNTIKKVADTESTVLITGESGTGKELTAKAIHINSSRCRKPFIVLNCGAIPGELLESELFGHDKGAFTGAHQGRMGRFEAADGGSIFLDEIGDMSPDLQVKLLRVLENQSFERVGSTKPIHVDVRIIAATNKNLENAIQEGKFREDLYYRLNVIPIKMPSLRDRKSDIPLLIDFFHEKMSKRKNKYGKKNFTYSKDAMNQLIKYDWPGNIRELENLVERFSVLAESDTIQVDDLPVAISNKVKFDSNSHLLDMNKNSDFNIVVQQFQKSLILHALNKTDWVKAKAAEMLNLNRTTLVEKIKKMNLESEYKRFQDAKHNKSDSEGSQGVNFFSCGGFQQRRSEQYQTDRLF
jgi:transcriptional regulator with GAF, ATPase, and Fis domain